MLYKYLSLHLEYMYNNRITLKENDNFSPTRSSSARGGQLLSWALNTCHDNLIYSIGMALSENHFSVNSTWTQPPHPRSRSGSQSWSRQRCRRQSERVVNFKMTTNAILLEHLGCGWSDKVGVDLILGRPWEPVRQCPWWECLLFPKS